MSVNIALGSTVIAECTRIDANRDGMAGINELVQAVGNALSGCS